MNKKKDKTAEVNKYKNIKSYFSKSLLNVGPISFNTSVLIIERPSLLKTV
jgi:hypothetical protein